MPRPSVRISVTTRRKAGAVLVATGIFAALSAVTTLAVGRPVGLGLLNGTLVGTGVGLFEEFYVHSPRGGWLRGMPPLRSIPVYMVAVAIFYVIALHLSHLALGRLSDLPTAYRRLPIGLTFFTLCSVIGILMMRIVHFMGLETLFHLMVGTYSRPVQERKFLLFLDINDSTALGARLGAFEMRALVYKFLFDVSQPITDHGGEIYLYKGDGLIAMWNWADATRHDAIFAAVDAMLAMLERERPAYWRRYGVAPSVRVGIHGGDVVVSEQGDTKRSIGIYGDTINIAARMEEAASVHDVRCVVSEAAASALAAEGRVREIGMETVKGIAAPIRIYEYRPPDRVTLAAPAAARAAAVPD